MNIDHLEHLPLSRPSSLKLSASLRQTCAALLCLTTAVTAPPVAAASGPSAVSEGSLSLAGGSLLVVAGSPLLLVGVPDWTIMGVELVADGAKLTLRGASETAVLVVLIPVAAVAAGALVVGGTVMAVAVAGGWMLSCAGEVIGFVARDNSPALLFSEPVGNCCPRCC